MAWLKNRYVKYTLAGVGAVYAFLFAGYLVFAGMNRMQPKGPSDLEAHPERQAEILAERRAAEMKDRLGLSADQVKQLADVFKEGPREPSSGPPNPDTFREYMQAQRDAMAKVLTPEQQEKLQQTRGPGGPGGRGGRMTPERMQQLMEKMTPEQQERAQSLLQRMQRRGQRGSGGPPGGRPPAPPGP
jgi:hypothetical protein